MYNQNCIDVKYVNNLSIPYLTRFFGSAGPILKIEKNQNSKYVTIEFTNKTSVDKALRFDGRVLDKEPIKIKTYKNKTLAFNQFEGSQFQGHNSFSSKRSNLINLKQTLRNSGKFKEQMWNRIINQLKKSQIEQNEILMSSMLIWRLSVFLMSSAAHLKRYKINTKGSHLLFQIERDILYHIEKKLGPFVGLASLQSVLELKNDKAWLWYHVPYPNTEEEQSKIEACSAQSKCVQKISKASPILGSIIHGLYNCMLVYNPGQTNLQTIVDLKLEQDTNEEDDFTGIVTNVGARDLFYEMLSYQLPNSCILMSQTYNCPQSFECSLRLVDCQQQCLQQKGWCDYFEAVVWKRWVSESDYYYHTEIKKQVSQLKMGQHSLIFQHSQFSCQAVCNLYKKYHQLHPNANCKVFYIRKQMQGGFKQAKPKKKLQKIYEDNEINIYQQVRCQQNDDSFFHQEVILNLSLIEIRIHGQDALNRLKLQHYLEQYIQESIIGKGLIIASKEMAYKLAANIIEREKDGRLFEFAQPKYEKYIGEQLWGLYMKQNQRKIKNNLIHYKLGKK